MTRTISMLIYAGGQSLDISGPLEVFALADRQAHEDGMSRAPLYRLQLVAHDRAAVALSSGMRVVPDLACAQVDAAAIDTLLISGGMGDALDRARANKALVDWLGSSASRIRRVGSICSGALLLAETGLLDGRQATTHWRDVAELRQRYPQVRVVPDAIYTRDGPVWTSAGVTAGMDLALAMVADDHGMPLALKVAKRMVMVSKRSGGQSQFSSQLADLDVPDAFARLAEWIRGNLRSRLSVDILAGQACMSPRHFGRRFQQAFGSTPQKYVEQLRVEAAKSLLENSARDLKRIASDCGFASEDAMRQAFLRHLGIRPSAYRERFGAA
ncbi:GlxA family transcriptional regulator [Pseudoxanthomonas wuyuanensis]|uniref:Transcriptional regulator, AraC family with amidase-like domain n=1 Tax=Pseudoxanthomonas wuyuanensis TaxID=1073196 RepID=A0A286DG34_9GAMM|nr:GlxA family transcriptional regulator [Pseudoxanthomonas wuyuanensis]KAF1718965.1 GlxA family transcriptional regulator [Pseudoxanthomonas wuyuanensis]SOD57540.1 transcriptional regulator, AraC family with amidase-like domain [Pseudoxanthomonas wuyuanensis]